jgi:hypothetical protein
MLNIVRIGLAAALVAGSVSMAAAQSSESPDSQSVVRTTRGHVRHNTRTDRQYREEAAPAASSSQQPWSSSFDAGNTTGGG